MLFSQFGNASLRTLKLIAVCGMCKEPLAKRKARRPLLLRFSHVFGLHNLPAALMELQTSRGTEHLHKPCACAEWQCHHPVPSPPTRVLPQSPQAAQSDQPQESKRSLWFPTGHSYQGYHNTSERYRRIDTGQHTLRRPGFKQRPRS